MKKGIACLLILSIIISMAGCNGGKTDKPHDKNTFDILQLSDEYSIHDPLLRVTILSTIYNFHNAVGLKLLEQYGTDLSEGYWDEYSDRGDTYDMANGKWIDPLDAIVAIMQGKGLTNQFELKQRVGKNPDVYDYTLENESGVWRYINEEFLPAFDGYPYDEEKDKEDWNLYNDLPNVVGAPVVHFEPKNLLADYAGIEKALVYGRAVLRDYISKHPEDTILTDVNGNTLDVKKLGEYLSEDYPKYSAKNIEYSDNMIYGSHTGWDATGDYYAFFAYYMPQFNSDRTNRLILDNVDTRYLRHEKDVFPINYFTNHIIYASKINPEELYSIEEAIAFYEREHKEIFSMESMYAPQLKGNSILRGDTTNAIGFSYPKDYKGEPVSRFSIFIYKDYRK